MYHETLQVRTEWSIPKEPHSDLLMPLLPYQKEGLGIFCIMLKLCNILRIYYVKGWMLAQEESEAVGGILADEVTTNNIIFFSNRSNI